MPKIFIPRQYHKLTQGQKEFISSSSTPQAVLKDLVMQYPELLNVITNDKYELKPFLSIFLNNIQIEPEEFTSKQITQDASIILVIGVAGG